VPAARQGEQNASGRNQLLVHVDALLLIPRR
jgi:hypothetical protein